MPARPATLAPAAAVLDDGSRLEVYVTSNGALIFRVVDPDGTDRGGSLTEADSDALWAEVGERRRAAA